MRHPTGGRHAAGSQRARSRAAASRLRQTGATLVVACLPIVLGAWAHGSLALRTTPTLWIPVVVSVLAFVGSGLAVGLRPRLALVLGALATVLVLWVLAPSLLGSPPAALAAAAATVLAAFYGTRPDARAMSAQRPPPPGRAAVRARAAAVAAGILLLIVTTFHRDGDPLVKGGTTVACALPMLLALLWLGRARHTGPRMWLILVATAAGAALLAYGYESPKHWLPACVLWSATGLLTRHGVRTAGGAGSVLDPVLSHPARFLVSSFLGMIVVGTLLLAMPWATVHDGGIHTIDAAFTAVSSVCVTGLIVLDTPGDFTVAGQWAILLLIQIGGLGMMSISTLVLHALGRRMSLQHERLLLDMGVPSRARLVQALRQVILFTFAVELAGAVGLSALFAGGGEALAPAIRRGVFTSVSAFCNAGFALQSDSLIGYQGQPLVLHLVAILIILGGLSPAVAMALAARARGHRIDPVARMVLVVTVVLLIGGALAYGLFEWRGSLADLSWPDRLHNAWFQSVTLRTAGFNSVDLAETAPQTQLMMLWLMFVGGSPGGTAGGIKTTTLAVLFLAVWTAITGRNRVVVSGRELSAATVFRAIAVLGTGIVVWVVLLTFLLLTQRIPAQQLVFETSSALGTVGLSTGATGQLDGAGKVLVMIAMFLGRLGPLTMFTLLSERSPPRHVKYPEMDVPIT